MAAILECVIAKTQIGFMQIIVIQNWYDSIEINFVSHFATFSNGIHLDWSVLFNIETTRCKYYYDTNLVEIHSAIIEILSFSCFVLFLVTANDGHFGVPNCKKIIMTSYKKHSGTSWIDFNQEFLRYSHFYVYF